MSERVVNLLELAMGHEPTPRPGRAFNGASLSELFGSKATGMGVYEIEPKNDFWPYHFHLSDEEFLIVLSGEPTLRTPDGERVLRPGDVAWFPAGAGRRSHLAKPERFDRPLRDSVDARRVRRRVGLSGQREDRRVGPWLPSPRAAR